MLACTYSHFNGKEISNQQLLIPSIYSFFSNFVFNYPGQYLSPLDPHRPSSPKEVLNLPNALTIYSFASLSWLACISKTPPGLLQYKTLSSTTGSPTTLLVLVVFLVLVQIYCRTLVATRYLQNQKPLVYLRAPKVALFS